MIELPIIGSLLEATGMIFEKKILKKRGMNFKNYTVFEFAAIVICMIPILFFTWRVDSAALSWANLSIMGFVIIASILANLLVFYSLKREDVTEFEPIWLMQPLFTVLLAVILFQSERDYYIVALALIASVALIVSHVKKHHFYFNKYLVAALIGSLLFAVELVISRYILDYYSGFSFYFVRCLGVFLFTAVIFRPKLKGLDKQNVIMIIIVGLIWAVYRAIMYYGYLNLGIVFTTTLFILSPVFMLVFAVIFLKEKITLKQIVSTVVIVACVVASVFV